jgi:cytochrome c556
MKKIYVIMVAVSLAGLMAGCNQPPDTKPMVSDTNGSPSLEQVKQETKEAAHTAKEYAYAQKSEFVEKMRKEIDKLNEQMDVLGEKTTSTAREEAKEKLKALREKNADLNKRLDRVNDSTESTWDDVKAGFRQGYEDTKKSFNDARQWLSEKIAPQ